MAVSTSTACSSNTHKPKRYLCIVFIYMIVYCAVRVSYNNNIHAHNRYCAWIRLLQFTTMAKITDISKLIDSAHKKLLASISKVNTNRDPAIVPEQTFTKVV